MEASHNAAAALALAALADSGVECGTTKEATPNVKEGKQKSGTMVNGSSSAEESGQKSRTLTPASAKKKKAKEASALTAKETKSEAAVAKEA